MKRSTKAVLLSGLVYPGLGQMVLGSKGIGAAFMALTTAGIAGMVYSVAKRASSMADQIMPTLGKGASGIETLLKMSRPPTTEGASLENASLVVVACCWAASAIHAYLLGKRLERPE